MTTVVYATFDDVNLAYEGSVPTADRPRVELLLRRASARLTRLMPSIPPRLLSGELDPDLPSGLVVEAVLRVYRNPEGVTAEEIGPFHKQFNPRAVAAEIQFDVDEVNRLLAPIANPARASIRLGLPTRAQTLFIVGGQSWDDDGDPADEAEGIDTDEDDLA